MLCVIFSLSQKVMIICILLTTFQCNGSNQMRLQMPIQQTRRALQPCSTAVHLDPEIHRWGICKLPVSGKSLMNVCGLRLLCREDGGGGLRYHGRENQGDQLMLSSPSCTCVPNYSPAQTKEAYSNP